MLHIERGPDNPELEREQKMERARESGSVWGRAAFVYIMVLGALLFEPSLILDRSVAISILALTVIYALTAWQTDGRDRRYAVNAAWIGAFVLLFAVAVRVAVVYVLAWLR